MISFLSFCLRFVLSKVSTRKRHLIKVLLGNMIHGIIALCLDFLVLCLEWLGQGICKHQSGWVGGNGHSTS